MKDDAKRKRKLSGWVLPKQKASFADPDKWPVPAMLGHEHELTYGFVQFKYRCRCDTSRAADMDVLDDLGFLDFRCDERTRMGVTVVDHCRGSNMARSGVLYPLRSSN